MNKKIMWIAALALSLILGQTAFADATHEEKSSKSCGCDHMKKMVESLKLDDKQQASLKAIKEQAKESEKANWQQMKDIRLQIDQMVQSDAMDESKLNDLINKKKDLFATMMKTKIMAKHQIYTILNTQQKTQYQQMMKQWEEQHLAGQKHC